ncbi:unnamed protein product, partial [Owenia fusiformis]
MLNMELKILKHFKGKRCFTIFIVLIFLFIHIVLFLWTTLLDPTNCSNLEATQKHTHKQGILDCLVNGTWTPIEEITINDKEKLQEFLHAAQTEHKIPMKQRADNRCGNVSVNDQSDFRALCDPGSSTPCCHSNRCVDKVPEKCTCDDCFDIRQKQHAEFLTWQPRNKNCLIRKYHQKDACKVLNDLKIGQISIIGDSLQRNLYSVLMMVLSGNDKYAVTRSDLPQEIKERCAGMMHFSDHPCNTIYLRSSGLVCNNTVQLNYNCVHEVSIISLTIWQIFKMWWTQSYYGRSLMILSIGMHENFDYKTVISHYINPIKNILNLFSASYWSEVLWVTPHSPGILKPPKFKSQQKDPVLRYIASTGKILDASGITVLNTQDLTESVFSWDGTHYGVGLNEMLLNIVFSYLEK